MANIFSKFFSSELAIDLGTANTLVFVKGRGIIINEPSIVAISEHHNSKRRILAIGKEAKEMVGRMPASMEAIRPMKDGVIADFESAQAMLKYFIIKAHQKRSLVRPKIVICVPFGVTEVEKRAVRESAQSAGAREVYLIEEPMAAAIGSGLPITEPGGNMIVDIGGGTTEVAVISLGGIVYSRSIRVGGDKMDEAIANFIKRKYKLQIGLRTAELIKQTIGTAMPNGHIDTMEIKGNDLVRGVPNRIAVDSDDVREAIYEQVKAIVESIKIALEKTPPELSGDIIDRGIILSGGGGLLRDLDVRIRNEVNLPVFLSENPLTAVVLGSGRLLGDETLLRRITF